jgi:hypothetical protein
MTQGEAAARPGGHRVMRSGLTALALFAAMYAILYLVGMMPIPAQ